MLPDRVSNPGPLTYESGALPIALRRPAEFRLQCDLNLGNCDPKMKVLTARLCLHASTTKSPMLLIVILWQKILLSFRLLSCRN